MTPKLLNPRKALNKAFLKVKPNRSDIEGFKSRLITLLDRTNDTESEEFHKNLVSDFLKDTYYKQSHFINTKGRNDLVIHNGAQANSSVGVIIEVKKPTNRAEMPQILTPPSRSIQGGEQAGATYRLNTKALQELVLYYLRERITHKNLEIKHLVATNIHEWFIIDAALFERLFAQNKQLVKQFEEFEAGRLSGTTTDFFYNDIARPFIDGIASEIEFTYFNLQEYQGPLRNADRADDTKLIALFKLLSPEHLLKLPFVNDSNSLDKRFYSELLHIIGLTETKQGSKKLIGRHESGSRHSGTIIEDAIIQLDSLDKLNRLDNSGQYGATQQERLFNVALELAITWVNRILFLKLLEAQLITYHIGDTSYAFLNLDKIRSYDDLNSLFFQVLARKHDERNDDVKKTFEKVPYLNSSLFEPTDIEQVTLFISNLKNDKTIPILSSTVLKDGHGKKRTGSLTTLEYLFEFLNAYDFSSEGSEEIQEDNKTLINASVLGLIFEKINGYKDGSFFTPGFITMYMCRETIRKAVVQKFNEAKQWDCATIDDVYNKIEDRNEANAIVNGIKICDPAVGSGHFLVSALNELIAIKSDLRILQDRDGNRLKEYDVEVVNDELIVTENDELFEYHPSSRESQRVQVALFHEKQTLIENCLFGVDINPNSVKICRLRLWIELLKNAYYKSETELETLPNIDINIKCGNSLVSRFALDADLKDALKKSKWDIGSYRRAVDVYRNAESKEQKREMERLIADIKSDFRSEISSNDPKMRRLRKLSGELYQMTNQQQLFEMTKKEEAAWNKKVAQLSAEIKKLEAEIEEIKANKIYENAFEWRFEFPEVLNDDGDFVGFDVVIGNPPYIRQEEFSPLKDYLKSQFTTYAGTADLYVYFVEQGFNILRSGGQFTFIIPNKWMRTGYGRLLRSFLKEQALESITDFGDLPVFEEATTYPCIVEASKQSSRETFYAANMSTLQYTNGMADHLKEIRMNIVTRFLSDSCWVLTDSRTQLLIDKLNRIGVPLGQFVDGKVFYGIKTGFNEAFIIDANTRDKLISEDPKSADVIKPFLAGRDIKRYQKPTTSNYIILFPKGITNSNIRHTTSSINGNNSVHYNEAWRWLNNNYPAVAKHLLPFKSKAEIRTDQGDYWWELRACDYYDEFEKPKIIYPNILNKPEFTFDSNKLFTNQKCFIITQFSLTFLGILNSQLYFFLFKSLLPKLRGDFYEPSYAYFKDFPVVVDEDTRIHALVEECISVKKANPAVDTTHLEHKIDELVYELYGLTEEEIGVVGGG